MPFSDKQKGVRMDGYNGEHYRDTTVQKAINNIEREEYFRIVNFIRNARKRSRRPLEASKNSYAIDLSQKGFSAVYGTCLEATEDSKKNDEGCLDMSKEKFPTNSQIQYARDLITKLGYDIDDYPLEEMSRKEISKLIDELKAEYE